MDYTNIINKPIIKENKFLNKLEYVMIFLMLYISSSFFINAIPGMIILGAHFVCVFILFIMSMLGGKKIIINSNIAMKTITLIAIIGLGSMSARGDDAKQTTIDILQILIAYLYALNFSFDNYIKKFTNLIYFLCFYSIVIYFLYIIVPDIIELLPDVKNSNGHVAQNAIFSVIYNGKHARNQSIFWEPGAFQTYINLALLAELFYLKNITKKRFIVYTIGIFTTYSTAGYIAALFIVYAYVTNLIFTTSGENKNRTRNLFFVLTVVIIVVFVFASMDTVLSNHVFGKFDTFFGSGGQTHRNTTSSVRFEAFIRPFKVFWNYPMFGAGTRGMHNFAHNERYNLNTCTFVNWFAYFGIFFGSLMMQMFYKFAKQFTKNKLIVFMIFFAIFLVTASENYHRNPSILIFAFFPFVNSEEEKKNENLIEHKQL